MKSPRSLITACFLLLLFALNTAAQTNTISAAEAKDHVGEVRTVCGKVASTHFAAKGKGQPTFLNLDTPYPKAVFTILIWVATAPSSERPRPNMGIRRSASRGKSRFIATRRIL